MPAVTVSNIPTLPRVPPPSPTSRVLPVDSVTTAPRGFEGDGFPVRRAFSGIPHALRDPFVLLDEIAWHPYRGFETVTYMIEGLMQHYDSNGGGGLITNGDTQWMTAEGDILHFEHPPEHLVMSGGLFHGLQLWVNLRRVPR